MEKKAPKAVPILIAIAMVVVVIIMVGIFHTGDTSVQQWDTVPVTITRVDENIANSSLNKRRIYVSYEYNGVWYQDIWLRGEGVLMESGGQRYAKVNPENPGQVSTVKNTLQINSDYVFVVFFAVVVIGVLVLFFGGDKKSQNE